MEVKDMDNCLFCKIVRGDIPSYKVYEDEEILAFKDVNPEAPVHILIVPKKHIASVNELEIVDAELIGHIFLKARAIAKELGINNDGYRILTNCGENAGQTVHHLHYHLLGGMVLNKSLY
jgi:histidine triad (HIT) family protein